MKTKSSIEWMFNPFTRLAGWPALGLGLAAVVLMAVIGAYSQVIFDGVIDVHFASVDLKDALALASIGLGAQVVVFWVAGLLLGKSVRFIDVAGTLSLAKAPFLMMAFIGFLVTAPDARQLVENPMIIVQNTGFMGALLLSLPIIAWSITLMHNAYKVSCGLSGSTLTISFIVALLVSEALSKLLIHVLL